MVGTIGIIGVSEGNGHPFSYSSILNGYSGEGLAASGWPGIYEYVRRRHASEFGIQGWRVTHAWTQEPKVTDRLCAACKIPNRVDHYEELIGKVDAVIVARDDFESHLAFALPFLKAGIPTFVDKPLSLSPDELRLFKPYLEAGLLMSCSGMRYARELDAARSHIENFGQIKLIQGAVLLSWEKYGVHLLEAALSLRRTSPVSIRVAPAGHMSASIRMEDGSLLKIDAMGAIPPCFRLTLFGTKQIETFEVTDNFSMFRRMLWDFVSSIHSGKPVIPPSSTINIMKVLIAGRIASAEDREVRIDEIAI